MIKDKGERMKDKSDAVAAFVALIISFSSFYPLSLILYPLVYVFAPPHSLAPRNFFLVLGLVSLPLGFLILGSFSTARLPGDFSLDTMGLVNYIKVYTDPGTYELLPTPAFTSAAAFCSASAWP